MRPLDAILVYVSSVDRAVRERWRLMSRVVGEHLPVPLNALTKLAMLFTAVILLTTYALLQGVRTWKRKADVHDSRRRTVACVWDAENCCPPRTADLKALVESIKEAARSLGQIESIRAYVVARRTASSVRLHLALNQLGVEVVEIENNGRKELVDHYMSFELGRLTTDAVLLISMDRDFTFALRELADRGVEVGVIGFAGWPDLPAHHRWALKGHKLAAMQLDKAVMLDAGLEKPRTPHQLVRDFAPLLRALQSEEEIPYEMLGRRLGASALRYGRQKVGMREYLLRAQQARLCLIQAREGGGDRIVTRGVEFSSIAALVTPRPASPSDDPFHRLLQVLRSNQAPMAVADIQGKVSKRWLRAAGTHTIGQYITAASNEGIVIINGSTVSLAVATVPSTPRAATPIVDDDQPASIPPSPVFTSTSQHQSSPASSAAELDSSMSPSPSRTIPLTAKSLAALPSRPSLQTRVRTLSTPSERPLAHRLLSRTSSMGLSLGFESDRIAAWSSTGSSHGAPTDAGTEINDDNDIE